MVADLVMLAANAAGQRGWQEATMWNLRRLPVEADERARRRTEGSPRRLTCGRTFGAALSKRGAAPSFPKKKITRALREYAIAGTLHLDHLAQLRKSSAANAGMLELFSFQLSRLSRYAGSGGRGPNWTDC